MNNECYERNKLLKYKYYEIHADGVKEVNEDELSKECPFCEVPCERPWCPYTKEEE